jgi:trehalose/maltose transport system substrate-binding protein
VAGSRSAPTQVSRLLDAALTGQISRREMMKRGAAMGLSAGLLGRMFATASRSASAQTPQPAGWSLTAPKNLRTDLKGAQIAVILGADGPVVPWEQAAVKLFSDTTGVQVKRTSGPESTTERLAQYQQLFGAQASDVDAMMIDVIWPGIIAQHAFDLGPAMKSIGATFFERIVDNNTVDGALVGIPWYTDAGVLYYRKDLLDKYGASAPPATWADLETLAKKIIDGERSSNPDFQGFVWQGAAYEGLTCDALEWQVSNGGGTIVDKDAKVTVNNPQVVDALKRAQGWVGTISPKGVTTYLEEDARGVWQAGNSAFMRNWPYAYSLGQAADSKIKDKFDITLVPKGDGADATNADCLGGWQLMVSKYSKNTDAAAEFAKFMCSPEVQKSFAIEQSRLPTIPDLYDDKDVLAANPYYARLKPVFLGGAVARPSTVTKDLYNDVSTAYFTAVNQILTGQAEPAAGVQGLQSKLENILADL